MMRFHSVVILGLLSVLTLFCCPVHAATQGSLQLPDNGLGWGEVSLGMPYEEAKSLLKKAGFSLRFDLGMLKREDYTYTKIFGASGKIGDRKVIYTVTGEMLEKKVCHVSVSLEGIDDQSLFARLNEIHGAPTEQLDEYNFHWKNESVVITGFLMKGSANLGFSDLRGDERIRQQAEIDSGSIPGQKTPPTPEVEYFNRTQRAFADALPPVPDGWEQIEGPPRGITIPILSKSMDRPMPLSYRRTCVNRSLEEEFEQKQAGQVDAMRPEMESARTAMEQKLEALKPKMEAIAAKIQTAALGGNMKEVERLQKELEKIQTSLGAEGEAMFPSQDAPVFAVPEGFDSRSVIEVDSYDLYGAVLDSDNQAIPWQKEPSVDGTIPVFLEEHGKPSKDYLKVTLHAFVGPVECSLAGNRFSVKRQDLKSVPRMGVACLHVSVAAGTRDRARKTLEGIDWKKLRPLVTPAKAKE